jgi:hypothetical protein
VAAYPFSAATRLEVGGGFRSLSFTMESRTDVYTLDGTFIERRDLEHSVVEPLHLGEATAALVHDTSYFGATAPIFGARSRLELSRSVGSLGYTSVLVDVRRYLMPKRPVTIAFRALHYGRYGRDDEHPQLVRLYAGHQELLHGYGFGSFSAQNCTSGGGGGDECDILDSLIGTRVLVGNIEARMPLMSLVTGRLEYGRVPIDVGAFMDAAVTWTDATRPAFVGGTRRVLRSAGGFARINVFGLFVAEVAASRPIDRPTRGWQWQFGIAQGF